MYLHVVVIDYDTITVDVLNTFVGHGKTSSLKHVAFYTAYQSSSDLGPIHEVSYNTIILSFFEIFHYHYSIFPLLVVSAASRQSATIALLIVCPSV